MMFRLEAERVADEVVAIEAACIADRVSIDSELIAALGEAQNEATLARLAIASSADAEITRIITQRNADIAVLSAQHIVAMSAIDQ